MALLQRLAFSSGFIYSVSVTMLSELLHHHLEQDSIIGANIRHEKNSKSESLGPCSTEILDSTPQSWVSNLNLGHSTLNCVAG